MPTSTVTQSGDLSDAATFGGTPFSDGNDIQNPASNGFTLTIDTDATVAGMGASGTGNGNGTTVVSSGVTLTLTGNVIQGNAKFTLGSGTGDAHFVFDTTAADRKFLFGDAANFTTYANCVFEVLGTSGAHCTVTKTGSNYCWFDDFAENSGAGAGKTGYDCTYCDFAGIGTSDGSFSLGWADFGNKNVRFDHSTFDGCGVVMKTRPYSWTGAGNKDYYVRDCRFTNGTGSFHLRVQADASSGSGTTGFFRNGFDASVPSVDFNAKIRVENNFFGRSPVFSGGPLTSNFNNLFHVHDGDSEIIVNVAVMHDNYWLAGLDHPGNPHCFVSGGTGGEYYGNIFEYPLASAIDSGECIFTGNGGINVHHNLAVPSATDGLAIGNMAHHGTIAIGDPWTVEHNTVVGVNAYGTYTEAGSDEPVLYDPVRSNMTVDQTNSASAAICFDVFEAVTNMSDPDTTTNNGMYGQISFFDSVCGQTLEGYRSHYTTPPGANDVIANPQFVDITRNFQNWAVYKGVAVSGDSQATKTTAAAALLFDDPTLIADDLMPWVKAGFDFYNAAFHNTGHDGTDIGAGSWLPTPGAAASTYYRQFVAGGGF